MIVKERKIELMKLASSAVYNEYSDIQKPKNTEEENFYNSWLITYREDKKESEDFKNKYELAKEEIQELVNQYVCNDYKFGGKFNNPIFPLIFW